MFSLFPMCKRYQLVSVHELVLRENEKYSLLPDPPVFSTSHSVHLVSYRVSREP